MCILEVYASCFLSGEVLYCANVLNVDLRGECPIGSLTLTQHCTVSAETLRRDQKT